MPLGLFTPGAPTLANSAIRGTMRVPADTQFAGEASPQSVALTIGQIGMFMPVGSIAVVAFAGGGQANATQLSDGINRIQTVATIADSVKLPPSVAGKMVYLMNAGANSTTVYGFGTDTIDGVASATGNAQAAGKGKLYLCTAGDGTGVAGTWVSLLGA